MNIRLYKKEDYELVKSWWLAAKEFAPLEEMLPEESTFILEINNEPKICLTTYLTNCKFFAYLENFVKDPNFNNEEAIQKLVSHVEKFVKDKGYRVLFCLSYKDKLKERYEELGYTNTLNNLSSFNKEL